MSDTLLPCPFCRGEAKLHEDTPILGYDSDSYTVYVYCTKCGCRHPGIEVDWNLKPVYVKERAEATIRWNTRN